MMWEEPGGGGVLRMASPIWIVRLPAAPLAHDDKLNAPRNFARRGIPYCTVSDLLALYTLPLLSQAWKTTRCVPLAMLMYALTELALAE